MLLFSLKILYHLCSYVQPYELGELISAISLYDYSAMISKNCPSEVKELFSSLSKFEWEKFDNHDVDFTSFELAYCISTGSSLAIVCT